MKSLLGWGFEEVLLGDELSSSQRSPRDGQAAKVQGPARSQRQDQVRGRTSDRPGLQGGQGMGRVRGPGLGLVPGAEPEPRESKGQSQGQ
jgi:hypothetical protein